MDRRLIYPSFIVNNFQMEARAQKSDTFTLNIRSTIEDKWKMPSSYQLSFQEQTPVKI